MTVIKRKLISDLAYAIRDILDITEDSFDLCEAVYRLNGKIEYFCGRTTYKAEEVVKYTDYVNQDDFINSSCHFVIRIDKDNEKTRQRFSIAHELGHLFLHLKYPHEEWAALPAGVSYKRKSGKYAVAEKEANEFAAAFLMPEDSFRKIAKKSINAGGSHYNLDEITKHFNVSVCSASYRGINLGIWQ